MSNYKEEADNFALELAHSENLTRLAEFYGGPVETVMERVRDSHGLRFATIADKKRFLPSVPSQLHLNDFDLAAWLVRQLSTPDGPRDADGLGDLEPSSPARLSKTQMHQIFDRAVRPLLSQPLRINSLAALEKAFRQMKSQASVGTRADRSHFAQAIEQAIKNDIHLRVTDKEAITAVLRTVFEGKFYPRAASLNEFDASFLNSVRF